MSSVGLARWILDGPVQETPSRAEPNGDAKVGGSALSTLAVHLEDLSGKLSLEAARFDSELRRIKKELAGLELPQSQHRQGAGLRAAPGQENGSTAHSLAPLPFAGAASETSAGDRMVMTATDGTATESAKHMPTMLAMQSTVSSFGMQTTTTVRQSQSQEVKPFFEIPRALRAYSSSRTRGRPTSSVKVQRSKTKLLSPHSQQCAKIHGAWKELHQDQQSEASLHGVVIFESLLKKNKEKLRESEHLNNSGRGSQEYKAMAGTVAKKVSGQKNSGLRTAWDCLALCFIVMDAVLIPYQYSLGVTSNEDGALFILQVSGMVYWTMDFLLHLMPSTDGQGCSQRFALTFAYMRSFCLFDLSLNSLDYALLATQSSTQKASAWSVLQLLRLLRVVRLKSVHRVEKEIEDSMAFRGHEWFGHVMTILKCVCVLAITGHMLGCFWVWLGRTWSAGQDNWLQVIDDADTPGETYAIAVHFILGHLTGAPVDGDILPMNHYERLFTFFLMLVSLLVLGYGVAQVQSTLEELTRTSSEEVLTRRQLQNYLSRIRAPMDMSVRIVTFVMSTYRRRRATNLDPSIQDLLSAKLLSEMTVIQRQNDVRNHPLFLFLDGLHRDVFNNVCNAIKLHMHEENEMLYVAGAQAKGIYYTAHGKFLLKSEDRDPASFSEPIWLCEASLFMRYNHTGTLYAMTYAETLQLGMADLIACVKDSPYAIGTVYTYGNEFLSRVQTLAGVDICDDLPPFLSEGARAAVAELAGTGTANEHPMDRIAVADPGAMEAFTNKFLKEAMTDGNVDDVSDEIKYTFQELNETSGLYALAVQPDERKRSLCSMLNILWLFHDRYDRFTGAQSPGNCLTEEQWGELRAILQWSQAGPNEIGALLVFLAIRGIGKVKSVVNLLPETHRSPEKAVLYIIEHAETLMPSFGELDSEMQELVKGALIVHDKFNFGQMLQGENVPSHILDLQAHVDAHGQDILKFYLLSTLGIFSGILGAKTTDGSLFLNRGNSIKVMRGIQCLEHLTTSDAGAIYWAYLVGYAESLHLRCATAEDFLLARLSCILRAATPDDLAQLKKVWSRLNARDQSILSEVFLSDGIEHTTFFFAFLPQYFENARKNPVIGLQRAVILLVDLIDTLRQLNSEDHQTIKVNLSELVTLAKTSEDAVSFDLFLERVTVESRGNEVHFVIRNRVEKDSVDAKLDLVARAVRLVSREIHTLASKPGASEPDGKTPDDSPRESGVQEPEQVGGPGQSTAGLVVL